MKLLKRPSLLLLVCCFAFANSSAQSTELSAVVMVISEPVLIQRAGTETELPLREGSIAPVGAGDHVRTGENGRLILMFLDTNPLYLLPSTHFELREFSSSEAGLFRVVGSLREGIAIQQFKEDPQGWQYHLETSALTVIEPSSHFAVWAVTGRLEAAISAAGELLIQKPDQADLIRVPPAAGLFATLSSESQPLLSPYHAAQLLALSLNCRGVVSTGGGEGLRLRRGAALDYQIVDLLQDGQNVLITGITENGLWYRIPFQTGFGWIYSSLVRANCPTLPRFPNLVGESNEQIDGVTPVELEFLEPFYGLPRTNPVFYQ